MAEMDRPDLPGERLADDFSERKLKDRRVVYEGRIWNVVQDEFTLDDESDTLVRDYVDHPGAVAVLALDSRGRILLVRQYRHPVKMNLWEIPAGLLDVDGEPFLEAARRELFEEADLRARTWNVLVDLFNSPGSSAEAIRIYLARDLEEVREGLFERSEEEAEMEYRWVSLEDAVRAALDGRLHNPSSMVGVLALESALAFGGLEQLRPADAPWRAHPRHR